MVIAKPKHLSNVQIADYVDGLLTPDERQRVEQHLRTCSVCRAEVRARRLLRRRIRRQRQLSRPKRGPLHL